MSDNERGLIEAGQKLVAAFGHRVGCPVLNRPEWSCGCGQADEHGEALSAWRNAVEQIHKENIMGPTDFSWALIQLKAGQKVARYGWNGKGMFVFLVPGSTFIVNRPPLLGIYPEGTEIKYHAHVDMKTADGIVVPWLCSQTDLLAEDWEIVS